MSPTQPVAHNIPKELLVVMGVSGSGKTTIAKGLQNALGWPFQEGDSLHPAQNVAKMASGQPLTTEDRWPWLIACRTWLEQCATEQTGGILTCSALKRDYRDLLRATGLTPIFIYLHTSTDILLNRLKNRHGHYMPASLLPSQLETLEPPMPDERTLTIDSATPPPQTIAEIINHLSRR
ncbi:MAG: gluconokinase [Acetobacter orientalis]|uniref:gluconokinase n=1 Tax=Acetobacter orientalis TaxID=146474 RepID=UPI0039ED5406